MNWQRDALVTIEKLRGRLRQVEYEQKEPIAIVGMGCRYPGGIVDPETFWRALEGGVDAVTEMPRERWDVDALFDPDPDAAGKMTTRSGGFVTPIDQFDAGFFGISPREAVAMDPQQRLLLETSWEALERAGIVADTLVGTTTGVFVGLMYQEYGTRSGLDRLDGYVGTGTAASIASGRISYVLGLQGPSLTVDTACSSSLVTVHLACQALRAGECTLALAGGVTLMVTPSTFVEFSRLRGLSSDGRCKSFAASADGTGWSEGCGMLVLERLSDARRNGHRVLGVIRGSAVNQDGRSNGMTAPNGPSQEAVIRRALAQAGVRPSDVGYVECHGTGTVLGDPIEVQALGSVLAEGRDPSRPVIIGSVKSNLAHTQAAAGVAGLIKVVLSMQHGQIPKSLHFDAPSPHVAWEALPVQVASEPVAWARSGAARLAGVSAFGISGTNAHVVIEEAPVEGAADAVAVETPARSAELVVLSAKSGAALEEMAQRLATHVKEHADQSLGDVAYSLATTRSHHEQRLSIVAATRESLVSSLEAAGRGEWLAGTSRGAARTGGKTAWLFTGQGSQHVGMGRGLWEEWPRFREAFDAACAALDPHLETPLREVMWNEPSSRLDETGFTQPALFALQVGLAALWRSWGVEPDVVAGHSIGEVAAAYVAGVFSLDDAARLVAARGRLMQALPRIGAMVAIDASEAEVVKALADRNGVSIAAVNGPSSIVISGVDEDVLAVSSAFAAKGARTKRLSVSHAFHSPLMDPMLDEFRRVAEAISYQPAQIVVVSNVSGRAAGGELSTAAYWVKHVREAVRFAAGIASLHASGVREYLEIGPRPTLLGLVPACLPTGAADPVLVASLRAERPESETILEALGAHHVHGGRVQWEGVFAGGKRVDLPTYAWDRQRYWLEVGQQGRSGEATGHPLLGSRVSLAGGKVVYEAVLSREEHAWLYDHRVGEAALMPGAGLAELVRAAGEHCLGEPVAVSSLLLQAPLVLPDYGGRRVQVLVSTDAEDGPTEVTVHSQAASASGSAHAEWTLHASGEVKRQDSKDAPRIDPAALRSRCADAVDVAQAYEELLAAGLIYGPAFRGLQKLWVGKDEALAEVVLPDGALEASLYGIHPALLDAAFQAVLGIAERSSVHLPFAMEQVVVHASGTAAAWVHARRRPEEASEGLLVDVTLSDAQGEVLVEVSGLRMLPAKEISRQPQAGAVGNAIHHVGWSKVAAPAEAKLSGRWVVVVAEEDDATAAVVDRLRRAGAECIVVDANGLAAALPADHVVALWSRRGEDGDAEAAHRLASAGLSMVQLLAKQERAPRLWWVTRGAMPVTATEPGDVAQAPLWGLGRTVMQEHPELGCTLVDVEDAAALVRELGAVDEEREIAWRAGERYVARLRRPAAADLEPRALRMDGTVLITGGLGALGMHVARWLAHQGIPHLVLTGRRGLANVPGAAEAVAELEAAGTRVTVAAVDVSDGAAVRGVLAAIPPELPLRGVLHAAGVLDDGVLSEQSAERFARVMGPKVDGACHLDMLTREADLDVFVLFSSIAGTLGSAGQGGYAAANACLDVLAARRRASGLPGQSLAWGLWQAGMASGLDRVQQARLAKSGLGTIDPAQGMALMASALSRSEAQLVLTPLALGVLRRRFGEMVPPLWRELVRAPRRTAAARGAWASELALLSEKEREAAVLATVRGEVARALSLPSGDAVDPDRPLRELGLDSLMGVELRNALGRRAGAPLPATLAFDHPTPAAIAKYLLEKVLSLSKASAVVVTSGPAADEPIAIVGIGCRYPGGIVDPETFWGVLEGGVDAVTEMPRERWDVDALYDPDPDAPGKMTTRSGGFVTEIDRFDAGFFGISPREAVAMDPQQRLLLETSWEALERAGIASETLVGTSTGVFVGLMYQEYGTLGGLSRLDGYMGTGSAASVASGRISYVLGLQGPSLTVDTACSSSLVTVHLACQALRAGECTLALAGGVALMVTPATFVEFSRLRGLSSDGRCKSFAATADGTGWSEGCGMVVLERLSDARRNGHRVLGVIRGSAVNQDGRSNGLTAPNGPSQEAVIRRALAQAGVRPAEVGYVECHGTGTVLGDPIEVQALGSVLAEGRDPSHPVILGSVKSNLGHTQAAAGVAGLIKVVLSMQHGQIPKSLHFDAPNPHIAWDALPVQVASEPVAWTRNGAARLAGVSAFGISGTNAHVVIEEAPVEHAADARSSRATELVVLSAKSGAALEEMAQRLAAHVKEHAEERLGDIAYSLATTRSHHEQRLSIVAATRESLVSSLEAAARGESLAGTSRGAARTGGKTAWLFTGQGSQHVGMGRGLWEEWPAFREAFDAACAALDPHLEAPLRDVMWSEPSSRLDETGFTQPALFALQVGLAALWRSWGVEPDVVAGHSIGEVAAAHLAGVFSLEDAARLVAARGRLMQALPRIGAMVAIDASEAEVVKALAGRSGVSIAAVNGPTSVVISGVEEAVLAVSSTFAAAGARTKRLTVSHAFHSPLMDPMLDEFRRVAEEITYRPSRLAIVSNVSGQAAGEELSTAEYWVRHVREAVRFAAGIDALHASGVRKYLEIGPRPTLLGLVPACLPAGANEPVLVTSLRANRAEAETILEALGAHHVHGGRVQWEGVFAAGGKRVDLPTYAWDRQRYWLEAGPQGRSGEATGHPLLGSRVSLAGGKVVYETVLSRGEHAWLYDHRVGDRALMPGAGLAELVRAAGEHCLGDPVAVSSLVLPAPLVLPAHGGWRVQVLVSVEEDRTEVTVHSQPVDASADAEWTLHASGEVRRLGSGSDVAPPRLDLVAVRSRCVETVEVAQAYEGLAAAGLIYGPAFRGLQKMWAGRDEALAEAVLPDCAAGADPYGIHPALLDAAFQAVLGFADRSSDVDRVHLPFAMEQVVVHAVGTTAAWVHARTRPGDDASEGLSVDVTLSDAQGEVLLEVSGLRMLPAKEISRQPQAGAIGNAIHHVGWSKVAAPAEAQLSGRWVVVAEPEDATAAAVVDRLRHAGAECVVVASTELPSALPADHVVALWSRGPDEEDAKAAHRLASAGLSMVQHLAKQERAPRLWWVTRGAMSVIAAEGAEVAQAPLWGLGRTVMQEHPELDCTLIDVEGVADAAALVRELGAGDEEREVAWRAGERYAARLKRAAAMVADAEPRALRTDGTVLITGGLGALGLHVARWLAQRGIPHLVLTGRRGLATPGAAEAVAELEAAGARVTVSAVDVSDGAAVRSMLAAIPPELPLRGVVHAAGALDDGVLSEQSAERFARVMGPKVDGACHLDALTREADLDVFVLFSSIAGTLGSAGQGGYAAANACLDALAARRRASGLAGQSLAWGLWTDASSEAAGLASDLDRAQLARLKKSGLGAIAPVQGMALMASALSLGEAQLMLTPLDLGVLRRRFGEMVPSLWRELVRVPRRAAAARGAWARELALLSEKERQAAVLAMVRGEVARVLSLPGGDAVEPDRPLKELGFDSLTAVELRNALGRRAGMQLPATLAFNHPTPAAIAKYLLETVLSLSKTSPVVTPGVHVVDEPIAIVGIGCRYPGGIVDPETFWGVLERGVDAVTEMPRERWDVDALYDPDPDAAGKMTTRSGGFVTPIDQFDAGFFGISPREAVAMDPQQRLLLETSWEALERAGITAESLVGSSTGVFVGLMYQEYATLAGLSRLDGYVGTGSTASIASGRISYVLGLQGPSLTVDTACSSSLVTVHLACQALRAGECTLALAGGVALMVTPATFVEFSRLRGLSSDGRCKSFAASSDGTGWSEGCGMVVLERLSDARRNGHRVLGLIRGSAVNQDGRSNGLTAPNGPSQEAVIRRALAQAGVRPAEVGYVECHGTGTVLGDPIEVQALGSVLAEGRDPSRPVILGSVKSNLGHTQAAAGVAGLIKVVLSMQHGQIPKNLHFDAPSPHIAWDALPVQVASEPVAWKRNGAARLAGVSAFGISGTNAHVVIEEAPVDAAPVEGAAMAARSRELVVLSAKSGAALEEMAQRLAAHVKGHAEQSLGDVAYSLATTRSHHEQRLAVVAASREALVSSLEAAARGEGLAGTSRGAARTGGQTAWLFTGQGSQCVGMGRGLWEEWPRFREAFDAACAALDPHLEAPLREVMWNEPSSRLDETGFTQPALFALEVGLSALWRSWGVEPDVVAGHSIGEVAAAHLAGVFSLEDAARLVAARGRLMQALPRIGAMVAIDASEAEVVKALAGRSGVSIAAVNGPSSIVISGEEEGVLAVSSAFAARGVRTKRLNVSHAFHSPLMDPMLDEFRRVAEAIAYRPAQIVVVSNVSGRAAGGELSTAAYWVKHVREAVRFAAGIASLHASGVREYLEIGPRPTLLGLVPACLPTGAADPVLVASLRAERPESETILEALGAHHVHGGRVQWEGVFAGSGRRVDLPTYAWDRQRYWLDGSRHQGRSGEATGHPLLGSRVSLAGGKVVYETVLSREDHAWLYDHRVGEAALMPGAGLAELVRAAGEHCLGEPALVSSLLLQAPLVLPDYGGRRVQVLVSTDAEDGPTEVTVHSQAASASGSAAAEWTLHASGEVKRQDSKDAPRIDLAALRSRCVETVEVAQAYEGLAAAGLIYGPAFRGLQKLWVGKNEALAEAVLPDCAAGADPYGIHPALLDAAFQAVLGFADRSSDVDRVHLPFAMERVVVHAVGTTAAWVHARMRADDDASEGLLVDVTLSDAQGEVLVEVSGLRLLPAKEIAQQTQAAHGVGNAIHHVGWSKVAAPAEAQLSGRWVVVAEPEDATSAAVVDRLRHAGAECIVVDAERLATALPADHVVGLWSRRTEEEDAAAAHRLASAGLSMVQHLAKQERAPRLWWVTRGAMSVTAAEGAEVAQAPLWGLGRTVMQEHPELDCTLIDVEGVADAAALVRELGAVDGEREVAWRAGERYAARLKRAAAMAADAEPRALRTDGTVLITGGLGALGLHVARWLAHRGIPHLVLTGRRGLATPGAAEAVAELEAAGARVTVSTLDVSDGAAVRGVLAAIPPELPLRGVVHAAGLGDLGLLLEQSSERFARVMAPKVAGASNLDAVTRNADLDFFVLFSSVASTLLPAGQGGYAAANACLDALAARRRASGLPGQSLGWGMWLAGMASGLDREQRARLENNGYGTIDPVQGIALMAAALERSEAQLVLTPLDLGALRRRFGEMVPPLWRELVRVPRRAAAVARGTWASELALLSETERQAAVLAMVRGEVARVLSLPGGDAVEPDRRLSELGLDSLMAVELRSALSRRAGAQLPAATWLLTMGTVGAIAVRLDAELKLGVTSNGSSEATDRAARRDAEPSSIGTVRSEPTTNVDREWTMDLGTVRLSVLEWGRESSPAVVCVHGSLDQALTWQPLARRLASRGLRVVALDLPGHGLSGHIAGTGGYSAIEAMRSIDALLARVKANVLIAHSTGGFYALGIAGAKPDNLHGVVLLDSPLVLLDSPLSAGKRSGSGALRDLLQIDSTAASPAFASESEAVRLMRDSLPESVDANFVLALTRRVLRGDAGRLSWASDPRIRLPVRDLGVILSLLEQEESVWSTMPALGIFGSRSPFTSLDSANTLRERLPRGRTANVETGHWPHLENPETTADLIASFLRQIDSPLAPEERQPFTRDMST